MPRTKAKVTDVEGWEDRTYLVEFLADAPLGYFEEVAPGIYRIKGNGGVYQYDSIKGRCNCKGFMKHGHCWHADHVETSLDEELKELYR